MYICKIGSIPCLLFDNKRAVPPSSTRLSRLLDSIGCQDGLIGWLRQIAKTCLQTILRKKYVYTTIIVKSANWIVPLALFWLSHPFVLVCMSLYSFPYIFLEFFFFFKFLFCKHINYLVYPKKKNPSVWPGGNKCANTGDRSLSCIGQRLDCETLCQTDWQTDKVVFHFILVS